MLDRVEAEDACCDAELGGRRVSGDLSSLCGVGEREKYKKGGGTGGKHGCAGRRTIGQRRVVSIPVSGSRYFVSCTVPTFPSEIVPDNVSNEAKKASFVDLGSGGIQNVRDASNGGGASGGRGGGTGRRQEGALEAGGRAVGRYLLSASALCLGPLEAEANRRSQSKVRQSSSCRVDEEKLQSWRTFNIQYSTVECPPISNGPGKAEGTATFTSNHWQTKFFISAPVNPARPPNYQPPMMGPGKRILRKLTIAPRRDYSLGGSAVYMQVALSRKYPNEKAKT